MKSGWIVECPECGASNEPNAMTDEVHCDCGCYYVFEPDEEGGDDE